MNTVIIYRNALDRNEYETFNDVPNVIDLLQAQFSSFPETARIYHNQIAKVNDVTPVDDRSIEHLREMTGTFYVVVYPQGIELIVAIVAIAIAAISIGLTFLFRPKQNVGNESSPNNELGDRQNQARPNERIPDIFGTVRSYPDLLMTTYKAFVNNKEYEYAYMGVSRGSVTVLDCRDGDTPVEYIAGEYAAVYPPYNSPNSLVPTPQATFGVAPTTLPKIMTLLRCNAVNGQLLRAPNSGNFTTNNNVRFEYGGVIRTNDSNLDFTEYFIASTSGNPQYLTIHTNDDGVNASDPGGVHSSVGLAGTYQILSVSSSAVTLSNAATVNANWNALSSFTGQVSTYFHTFAIEGSGDKWIGPFILEYNDMSEVWANFVAQNGLYYVDNKNRQGALTVTVVMQVQALDSSLTPIGDWVEGTANVVGSAVEREICGTTLKMSLPSKGSCQVRFKNMTPTSTDRRNTYVQQVQLRDVWAAAPPNFDPGTTVVQSPLGLAGLCGAFTDDNGAVIQAIDFGNGKTVSVPAGATKVQLGINDDNYSDNSGTGYTVNVALNGGTPSSVAVGPKAMPWDTSVDPTYPFGQDNGTAPVVALTGLALGDSVTVTYVSGSVHWSPGDSLDGNGDPGHITGSTPGSTGTGFPTKYMTTGGTSTNGDFGNITTVYTITAQTPDALSVKERKLNMLVTRNLPTWINRTAPGTPQFSTDVYPTNNAADILCAMALDDKIGRRTVAELDVPGIYGVADAAYLGGEHTDGEIVDYFGTFLMTEFCYTFDDSKTSFEEMVADLAQAINCTAYRKGSLLSLFFEKKTSASTLLFNHRNKIPDTEKRTVTFGPLNDNDGINYDYVDPNAPNYPATDTTFTNYYPVDKSAVNPRKVTSIGVRNPAQAWINGWRLYNKVVYANTQVEFTSTREAAELVVSERVLIADETRTGTQTGEITSQSGLTVGTSQKVTFQSGHTYTMFLQLSDGSVESMPVTAGASAKTVTLSSSPTLPLVYDAPMWAKTTYWIVDDGAIGTTKRALAFLVQQKDTAENGTFKLTAINYTDKYYNHDQDVNTSAYAVPACGYGPQGYIGIGLTTDSGGTYNPARTSFDQTAYSNTAQNANNNVTDPNSTPPPTSTASAVLAFDANGASDQTVISSTSPAADAGYALTKWKRTGTSEQQTASAEYPHAGGASADKTANYTLQAADCGYIITFNSGLNLTCTLPAAVPFADWNVRVQNIGTGSITFAGTPTIDGQAANVLVLAASQGVYIATDGTNYKTLRGIGASVLLQTNNVTNSVQTKLNLKEGSNVTISDDGAGNITFAAAGGGSGSGGSVVNITTFPAIAGLAPTLASAGFSSPTAWNQSATYTTTEVPNVGIIIQDTTANTTPGPGGILRAYPTVPFTLEAVFSVGGGTNNALAGLCIATSTTGKFIYMGARWANTPGWAVLNYNSSTSFNAFAVAQAFFSASLLGVKLQDDGTNIIIWFSNDGVSWTQVFKVAKASSFLGSSGFNYLGLCLDPRSAIATTCLAWNITTP